MKGFISLVLLSLGVSLALQAQDLDSIRFKVAAAPEWTNLFNRTDGWFGGDGIYSIPLNGKESSPPKAKKTLFIFSDSMIGKVTDGKMQPGAKMIHNAAAVLDGNEANPDKIIFSWQSANQEPESLFMPKTPLTNPNDYYWLGDGFVNQELNKATFIFGYRIKSTGSGAFGFAEVGNTLIKIKASEALPYQNYEQKDTPFYLDENGETGSFGAGIYVNTKQAGEGNPDGYIYVYGIFGKTKQLLVARVLPAAFENYNKWSYWDGTNWQPDIKKSVAVTDQVSNELSLSQLSDGRYALIFQQSGIGRNICMQLGKTPFGPFGKVIKLWDTTEAIELKSFFTYNAKAHPSLSKRGELLISYNVNSFDFLKDLQTNPNLYRPRFIKVKFE
ncbi:DUF4185 domain-containing protein [Pedobacter miscanthi]|jgi:hypothetical protein|uniref:DUF4185 domain-containing protein n=1 Tax=Pedobacter miscanthi TaxID=2259170 RepID=UPI0029316455|nr:DUF4185 domain-containing protein [Pedobacter miscanthi]